jgi:hypothetical protein
VLAFIESGRLGNQLFQYAALRSVCAADERLVLVGFHDLRAVMDQLDATFVCGDVNGWCLRTIARGRRVLDSLMARQLLVSLGREVHGEGGSSLRMSAGLFPKLRYCTKGYFQSESHFDPAVVEPLHVRDTIMRPAHELLHALGSPDRPRVFVHVRRGDYLEFPSKLEPAVLPLEWYHACMDRLRSRYQDPVFVVCSDDRRYVSEMFSGIADVHVHHHSPYIDFALMSACDGGVLSPSSYAWWAAYFANRRRPGGVFVGPEFWCGHRAKRWYPAGIKSSFIEYV